MPEKKMLKFEYATLFHLNNLESFINKAYRGDYAKKGWTTEADLLDGQRTDENALEEILKTPDNKILLAFTEDKLIGCAHLKFEEDATLYFGMLTVEPSYQSQGVGKKLLLEIERIAKEKKQKRLRITVIPFRSELIAYYERRGFQKTGNFEPFPEDPRYGIPKVKGLRLDEFVKVF